MKALRKSHKKSLALLIAVVVLLGAIIAVVSYSLEKKGCILSCDSSSQDMLTGKEPDGASSNDEQSNGQHKNIQPAYEGINKSDELSGVINYKSVVDNVLVIRTIINQVINQGSCMLTLRSSTGEVVTQSASITQNPSSSSCQGFDVSLSQLKRGAWNIEIEVKGDGKSVMLRDTVEI